jgi:hypothetical protein
VLCRCRRTRGIPVDRTGRDLPGPGLPPLLPGGGRELVSQDEVDQNHFQFHAVDAYGSLFSWDSVGDSFVDFAWETAGRIGKAFPVFPITAWC